MNATDPVELARWQGQTEERLDEHDRRLQLINGSIQRHAEATLGLQREVGKIGTKVAIATGFVMFLSPIVTALVVYYLTKGSAR